MKKNKYRGINVSKEWPLDRIHPNIKARAVQALVANHTLIVGQSRSGKTNAARRLIEEILAWTATRVVVLDPNADFKWLNKVNPDSNSPDDNEFSAHWNRLAKKIEIAAPDGAAWGIKWGNLSLKEMAAFLRLTPVETFAEYRHLDRHLKYEQRLQSDGQQSSTLRALGEFTKSQYFGIAVGEDLERYRLRLEELSKLKVWWTSGTREDLDSLFERSSRAVVVDLSMDDEQERMITAARALEALWRQGEIKRKEFLQNGTSSWGGTLVLIDEGHLFAPPATEDLQKRLVSERIQRFADQGKKLNLYLMVITQQPGKLHRDILSEFNNRIILRVNERQSLKVLEEIYGGLKGRYDGALTFEPGEALIEGALLCDESPPPVAPRGVRFKVARTREGGGTPNSDWAFPKS